MGWMLALVALAIVHPWIPQSRWLLVHMVTLGLVTTSIMIWGQHFTEALLKTRLGEESRPRQVIRIRVLTGAIIVVAAGMVFGWPWLTAGGAAVVSAVLLWYAAALGAQLRAALAPRFAIVVRSYLIAACLLPVGAVLGAILAFSPGEPWQGRLLLAHQLLNVLGFVGLTACATLITLWPTLLRTKIRPAAEKHAGAVMLALVVGVLGAMVGALVGSMLVGVVFLLVYAIALGALVVEFVRLVVQVVRTSSGRPSPLPRPLFAILSVGSGIVWFALAVIGLIVLWIGSGSGLFSSSLTAQDAQRLTVPLVAGFLVQLLFGAMSYLMPTVLGGGPAALSAGLTETSRFAVVRVVAWNLVVALVTFGAMGTTLGDALFAAITLGTADASGFGSISRVVVAALGFAVMLAYVVLLVRAVVAGVRARRAAEADRSAGGPATLGMPGGSSGGSLPVGPPKAGGGGASLPVGPPKAGGGGSSLPVGPPSSRTGDGNVPAGTPSVSASTGGVPAGTSSGSAARGAAHPSRRTAPEPSSLGRRHLTGALVGIGSVLGVTALGSSLDRSFGSAPGGGNTGGATPTAVTPTGHTTTIAVSMKSMRFHPDRLEVPAGDRLRIEVTNDDPSEVHDLVLASGPASGRLQPGQSATVEAGIISHDVDGWCSIVGHRSMGMVFTVVALGATGAGTASSSGAVDPLTAVTADLTAPPGDGYTVRDARLPDRPGKDQELTLTVTEQALEIAPGVTMAAMTYDGVVMGPILRGEIGSRLRVHLVNKGPMGHSLDMHAGRVSPDQVMRTIPTGKSLDYPITLDYGGIWLYHCATTPMTIHVSAGMFGALVVPPQGIAAADREYVLVQSDHYLVPDGAVGSATADHSGHSAHGAHDGNDGHGDSSGDSDTSGHGATTDDSDPGSTTHAVSPEKIAAGRPDFTVFNGHATQYHHQPLTATVGERVRIWALAAGPSRPLALHVVGVVFDTVFKEGQYLLRPDNDTGGGAQVLDLAPAQGGFVEMVFEEPGTYTVVNHDMADMERGAMALVKVTRD